MGENHPQEAADAPVCLGHLLLSICSASGEQHECGLTWSPGGGAVGKDCGNFQRQILNG